MSHHQVNARRLFCPMPVIRAQDRIAELQPGDTVEVLATDPGAINDISAWCRINGHNVLQAENEDGEIRMLLEVGAKS